VSQLLLTANQIIGANSFRTDPAALLRDRALDRALVGPAQSLTGKPARAKLNTR